MATKMEFADDARRLLRGFAGIEQLANAFEQAGQLEQQVQEHTAALAALKVQVEAAQTELGNARTASLQAKAERLEAMAQAEKEAAAVAAWATKAAAETEKAAEVAANERRLLADADVRVAQAELDALALAKSELATQVADLEKRAEKARAYLTKLGGAV